MLTVLIIMVIIGLHCFKDLVQPNPFPGSKATLNTFSLIAPIHHSVIH